ncbi:MAG: site-specific tyrosine recombinase XerD [Bacteroidota bacterium]
MAEESSASVQIPPRWAIVFKAFKAYLELERGRSKHTISGYATDLRKLPQYLQLRDFDLGPTQIERMHLDDFLAYLHELGLSPRSQARLVSALRTFFQFLLEEEMIETDPTELLRPPKIGRKLPSVLDHDEVERILSAVDLSKSAGHRDRAILEVLYACGLRVSELTNLTIDHVKWDRGLVKVIGKGNKERWVPIGDQALRWTELYVQEVRSRQDNVKPEASRVLFLNLRGGALSRVAVFNIVKSYTSLAKIEKTVSPHTFRHSFATHLIEGGADLRAVQEMLGHESILTTEIYTHLDMDYLRETVLLFHPMNRR